MSHERPPVSPELREKILSNPEIAKLAENLGVPLEDFIKDVAFYMTHPAAEPQVTILSDAELRANGLSAPSQEALIAELQANVKVANAGVGPTGYDPLKEEPVVLNGAPTDKPLADRDESLQEVIKRERGVIKQ